MYMFSRRIRLAPGNTRAAMEWATQQTELVNRITDLHVALYAQSFSPGVGTLSYSAFVPDLTTLEAAADKLAVDEGFLTATDQGASFLAGGADDMLAQVVYGEPDPSRRVEYATAVQAVCGDGHFGRGIQAGIEIAQKAEAITGNPGLFLASVTGSFGGVAWISGHESIQALEASEQALLADPSWIEFVDEKTTGVYAEAPELTTQTIYRRVI